MYSHEASSVFIYLFIYLFKDILVNVLIKKTSFSLESKTGENEQLVMLKGLYRPEQCKICPKKLY